jgi:hypothetical protein
MRLIKIKAVGTDIILSVIVDSEPTDRIRDDVSSAAAEIVADFPQTMKIEERLEVTGVAEGLEFVGSFVPGVSEALAVKDFAEHPSVLGAAVVGASLVDAGGLVRARSPSCVSRC